ncbi:MAG: PAS domain S-box protein [Syntrophales bacterium]
MDDEKKVAIRELAASDGPHDRRNNPAADAEPPGHAQVEITKDSLFFSRFVDLSSEAMYVRVNDRLVFVNTRFTEIAGYSAEELLAPDFDFMTLIAPASRPLIEGRVEQITRLETPPLHYTFQAVTKDGRLVEVESSVSYLSYSGGLATIGVCRDVTERIALAGKIADDKYRRHHFSNLGSDFIHECRRDGPEGFHFVWLDGAFTRVTGYSREELMAFRCWLPLIHPDDASSIQEVLSGMKGDDRHTLVFRIVTKDGRIRWIEDNTLCVADRRLPETHRLYGACRDVTDRKEAELLYKVLAESSFAGVYVVQDGIFRYLNKNAALYAEYAPEELTGSHAGILVHPEDKAHTRRRAREMLKGQRLTPYEFRIITKSGGVHWIMETISAVEYQGRPAILGNSMDVTEKMNMENALMESEARYRQLFENAVEGVFQSTPQGTYVSVNPAFARMYGYASPEEIIAAVTNIGAQLYVHQEDRREIGSLLETQGFVEGFEAEFRRKDGVRIWGTINARAIRDDCGLINYYEGTIVDITERKLAEEGFRRQYRFLRTLLDSIPVPLYYVDAQGVCVGCNQAFADFIARTTEEIVGISLKELWQDDSGASGLHLIWGDEGAQEARVYETVLTRADNTPRDVIVSKAPFFNLDGSRGGEIGSFIDITDRKMAEKVLSISEEKYRNILESIEDGYYEVDLAGNFTFFNPSMCTILGYASEEMTGMNNRTYMDSENAKKVFRAFNEVSLTRISTRGFDWEIIQKSGARRNIEVSVSLIVNPGEKPTGFRGIARDITEKRQAEVKLKESEEKYRDIFENAIEGIYQSSPAGRFLSVNPYLASICGYDSPEEMVQGIRDMATQFYFNPEDRKAFCESLEQDGRIENCEYRIRRKDGVVVWVSNNARCVRDAAGRVVYYEGALVDITDRKAAERELERHRHHLEELVRERTEGLELEIAERRRTEQDLLRAKEAAEAANRAKSAFLANMSHELRTPLNAVIGFSDVLIKQYFGPLNDKQEEYARDIAASGQHLLDLINDVLDLAKIEAGKDDLYYAPVSLLELFGSSLSIFREKARRHNLELRIEGEESLASLTVTADARKLKQALYNLLSNATKFTPDGGRIIVRARVVDEIVPGGKGSSRGIEISVTDTGIGIAREDQGKIFEEFHQVYDPTVGKSPGTGLGLALTRRVIALHGGCIWVESAGLGKGSAFIFRIPCAPPQGNLS